MRSPSPRPSGARSTRNLLSISTIRLEHYAAAMDLLLPESATVALLAERLELEVGRERRVDRVLLDSFDGRLRAEGLRAEGPAGRSRGSTLTLHEPGAAPRRATVERAPRYLGDELPRGPL